MPRITMQAVSGLTPLLKKLTEPQFFKDAILLCENLEVYICLRLDTPAVHHSRLLPINYRIN